MYKFYKRYLYRNPLVKFLPAFYLFSYVAVAVVPPPDNDPMPTDYCDANCELYNKLDNGDFEDTLNHWTTSVWTEDNGEATYSGDDNFIYAGELSQQKDSLFQPFKEYKVCFDLYIENHDAEVPCEGVYIAVFYGRSQGSFIYETYNHSGWDNIEYTFQNWGHEDDIKFQIINPNGCNITVKLDNVCILEIDTFDPCEEGACSYCEDPCECDPCICDECICWLDEDEPEIHASSSCALTTGSFFVHPYNQFAHFSKLWILTSGSDTIATSTDNVFNYYFLSPGSYNVEVIMTCGSDTADISTFPITITESDDPACLTYNPVIGKQYWISGWVKENNPTPVTTYQSSIEVVFHYMSSENALSPFTPSGEIIDGWQRISGWFVVAPYEEFEIRLNNNASIGADAFFDDIRIHPFDANMKSYVYDTETYWLRSELDENNYATFYEYDEEGKLIRIKKETEKGIFTIQEGRTSGNKKD